MWLLHPFLLLRTVKIVSRQWICGCRENLCIFQGCSERRAAATQSCVDTSLSPSTHCPYLWFSTCLRATCSLQRAFFLSPLSHCAQDSQEPPGHDVLPVPSSPSPLPRHWQESCREGGRFISGGFKDTYMWLRFWVMKFSLISISND